MLGLFSQPPHHARLAKPVELGLQISKIRTFVSPNPLLLYLPLGGGGGIRTHGRLPFTRFPSVPIRPLSHSSESVFVLPIEHRLSRLPDARGSTSGSLYSPRSTAVVGSRATDVREPSQGWKPAALSGLSGCHGQPGHRFRPRLHTPPLALGHGIFRAGTHLS